MASPRSSRNGRFGSKAAGAASLLAVVLAVSAASAAEAASADASSIVRAAAILAPLALSPFLALGALGLAGATGFYTLPAGIAALGNPLVVFLLLVFGLALHVGRSSKLTKPLAEAAGVGESTFALVIAFALAVPILAGGLGTGLLQGIPFLLAAGSGVLALIVIRTAFDLMIWLSPFPFVDGLFQGAKVGLTTLLVVVAIASPPIAVVLNILLLVAAFWFVRWAIRTVRFGLTIAYDLTFGRSAARRAVLPRDEVIAGDLGPFSAFALSVPAFPRRAPVTVELRAGRWFVTGAGWDEQAHDGQSTPLGDAERSILTPTWAGIELAVGETTVLLPPRYRGLAEQLRRESRATLGDRARWVPRAGRERVAAGPSTL